MVDDVIHDDSRIGVIDDFDPHRRSQRFPLAIDIMNKYNESSRSIRWAEGHNRISPLDSIRPLKSKFLLTSECDS